MAAKDREPLLNVFPRKYPSRTQGWWLQLPHNVSPEMREYADSVARRAWIRHLCQSFRQQDTIDYSIDYSPRLSKKIERKAGSWNPTHFLRANLQQI